MWPIVLLAAVAVAPPPAVEPDAIIENAVVQVFSVVQEPDVLRPWAKQPPREASGSGVVIDGRRILTSAHVVAYASQVQVQANHAGDKLSARVKVMAPGIDLALLELDEDAFFDSHAPLPRASTLPAVKDSVLAYGFPTGGSSLSITKGIVSRIEFTRYDWNVSALRIQIDAAVNPGNSGGPAVAGDKMIGLVFAYVSGAQSISYIVPCEEIEIFLADVADGQYQGKPALFDELQTLENDALRAFLRLDRSVEGLVVTRPHGVDGNPLKQWDVISRIGDTRIDDQGSVAVEGGLRVRFRYLVQKIAKAGMVPLTVWRNGKELALQVPAPSTRPLLTPDLQGTYPSYFIYGPLVASAMTAQFYIAVASGQLNLAQSWPGSPLMTRAGDRPAFPGEELVVISSPFFPHPLAKGYGNPMARVISSVNGTKIRNLRHLVEALRDLRDDFVIFEFAGPGTETLVFPRKEVVAATDTILGDNGIRSQGSPDVMAVWNAKP